MRRQDDADDIQPANGTLREYYGALIEDAITESIDDGDDEYAALYDDNANDDLQADEIDDQVAEVGGDVSVAPASTLCAPLSSSRLKSSWDFTFANESVSLTSSNPNIHLLGSKVSSGSRPSAFSFSTQGTHMRISNSTALSTSSYPQNGTAGEDVAIGTVVANSTHMMLRGGKPVQRTVINAKLFISDLTFRVFHPTQAGHAMIANLVLFQMAQDNAKRLGMRLWSIPRTDAD